MILITTQDKIATVAERWWQQYNGGYGWKQKYAFDAEAIYKKLAALPANATAESIAAIMGNTSWIEIECDECEQKVERVVRLGQEPEYETATAWICPACLHRALALIESKEE